MSPLYELLQVAVLFVESGLWISWLQSRTKSPMAVRDLSQPTAQRVGAHFLFL